MKIITTIILFVFAGIFVSKAQEKWDAATCHYTNHKWHFHWNLDETLEWEKTQSNEQNTVFKAVSPFGITAYLNIMPFSTKGQESFDFWNDFEDYKKILRESWNIVEQRTGGKITPLKIEKCRFFGEKAIKVLVKTDIDDDVVQEASYGYTYTFHKDGATWSASINVSPEVWDYVGEDNLKNLFLNLGPNARP